MILESRTLTVPAAGQAVFALKRAPWSVAVFPGAGATAAVEISASSPATIAADPAIESAVFRDGAWVLVCPEPEPVLVPRAVTRFQARAALHLAGLLPQVEALMTHPDTPMLARLAWADALEFRRESETVAAMSAALGLSGEQIDALFVAAAGIEA